MQSGWQLLNKQVPKNLMDLESLLLLNRKIKTAKDFFQPKRPDELTLSEVGLSLTSLHQFAARIKKAQAKQEKVVIFGDYDVDGISASAIMWQTLHTLGLNVVPFIPLRQKHGYGLSQKSLADLLALKPNLVITVDNGIVAHQPALLLHQAGVDLIITDHHQPKKVGANGSKKKRVSYPLAEIIIHSTKLCGASVAWMAMRQLVVELKSSFAVNQLLDLAGMATIADQVPLLGANRSFAYHGLRQLRQTKNIGLQALIKQAGVKKNASIDEMTVGFRLAPRINALGRLAHGLDALRLLCSTSVVKVIQRAQVLADTNSERQHLTSEAYAEALQLVKQNHLDKQKLIIVASENFHEGVIGLIAGRLVQEFSRPALVIALGDDGLAKGSARSLPGIHITELLRQVERELLEVGGHPMAAGFGLKIDRLEKFKTALLQLADQTIDETLLISQKSAEAILPFDLINPATVEAINRFAPFGMANPRPLFIFQNLKIVTLKTIGADQKHLKLILSGVKNKTQSSSNSQLIELLWWRAGEKINQFKIGQLVDVLGTMENNEWRGQTKVQLVATAVKLSKS